MASLAEKWNIDQNSWSPSSSPSYWPWDPPVFPNPSDDVSSAADTISLPSKPIFGEPHPYKPLNHGGSRVFVESTLYSSVYDSMPWANAAAQDRRSYAPKPLFIGRKSRASSPNPSTGSINSSCPSPTPVVRSGGGSVSIITPPPPSKGHNAATIWKDVKKNEPILNHSDDAINEENSPKLSRFTVLMEEDEATAKESTEYRMEAAESRFRKVLIDVTENRPGSGVVSYSMHSEDCLKFDCYLSEEEFWCFMATGRRNVVMSIMRQDFEFGPAPSEDELNKTIAAIAERVGTSLPM